MMAIGMRCLERLHAAGRHQYDQDLLGGVGRRGDGVRREHGQRDQLDQPVLVLLGRRDGRSDEDPLQRRVHQANRSQPIRLQALSTQPGEEPPGVHVVIVGCGRVGSALALNLTSAGHTVADHRQAFGGVRRLGASFTGQAIAGIGFDRDRLTEAGIERAGAPSPPSRAATTRTS